MYSILCFPTKFHFLIVTKATTWASKVALVVKKLPAAVQETWVQSLGQDDPLEEDMATHSTILVWRVPWIEEPGGLQSMGIIKSWT